MIKPFKSKERIDTTSIRKGPGANTLSIQNQTLDTIFTWYSFQPVKFPLVHTRDRIIDELLRTEQLYLKNMITMLKVFKEPLLSKEKKLGLPPNTILTLFGNCEDVVAVNQVFLDDLVLKLSKWSDTQTIGDVLERMTPFFRLYKVYANNSEKSLALFSDLNDKKDFREFVEELATSLTGAGTQGLTLNAFLLMPIQRILRYRLLLDDFIKNTEPTHVDYEKLKKSFAVLLEVANQVNAAAKQQEEIENMLKVAKKFMDYKELGLIQPGRKIIMEGNMLKVCRKENKKRRFFLFSDLFLYATPSLKGAGDKFEIMNQFPLIEMVAVKDLPDQPEKGQRNILQVVCETKSFNVLIETAEEKEKWMQAMKVAIDTVRDKSKSLGNDQTEGQGAAVWISDHEVKACMVCSVKFTMINRRHHCRQCGAVVCGACTTHKKELPKQGKQRVCDNCFNDVTPEHLKGKQQPEEAESDEDETPLFELTVLFDYQPILQLNAESKRLPLKKGDKVTIYQTNPNGWWLGELRGNCGWVPATFLEQPREYACS